MLCSLFSVHMNVSHALLVTRPSLSMHRKRPECAVDWNVHTFEPRWHFTLKLAACAGGASKRELSVSGVHCTVH